MLPDEHFKRAIIAYLHDPPCKFSNLYEHQKIADSMLRSVFGEDWEKKSKVPDWRASAGDRLCFPLRVGMGSDRVSVHPFSGDEMALDSASAAHFEEATTKALVGCLTERGATWKERFFLIWRFWESRLAEILKESRRWPAETRMPTHTIWTHMDITAALAMCEEVVGESAKDGSTFIYQHHDASLLTFQFGPVQDWVTSARSTKDCWAGSHILSRIVAAAVRSVTDACGPTAILSPSLKGNPLFDLEYIDLLKNFGRWDETEAGGNPNLLKIASLPHRFTALVPTKLGKNIAEAAVADARLRWLEICNNAWVLLAPPEACKNEWDRQVEELFHCSWQLTPIPKESSKSVGDVLEKLKREGIDTDATLAEVEYALAIPDELADTRNYVSGWDKSEGKYVLKNFAEGKRITAVMGVWESVVRAHESDMAARRNARQISRNIGFVRTAGRDELDGKYPIVAEDWQEAMRSKDGLFKKNDLKYGAPNLVKRAYPDGFVRELRRSGTNLSISAKDTRLISQGRDYFAVLSMDGDSMGEWASGSNNPTWENSLPKKVIELLRDVSSKKCYGEALSKLLKSRRSLRPSQMLQFSEVLKNYAVREVGPIVEAQSGELIYSGGDDVLVFLPATMAISCATKLQKAFSKNYTSRGELLPGGKMSISAGICIAHYKEPLQSVIRSSRDALELAKGVKGDSGGIGIKLDKHSGETIEWRMPLSLYNEILFQEVIGGNYSHGLIKKLASVLYGYTSRGHMELDKTMLTILSDEIRTVVSRSKFEGELGDSDPNLLADLLVNYLEGLTNYEIQMTIVDFMGPLLTSDFIRRKESR